MQISIVKPGVSSLFTYVRNWTPLLADFAGKVSIYTYKKKENRKFMFDQTNIFSQIISSLCKGRTNKNRFQNCKTGRNRTKTVPTEGKQYFGTDLDCVLLYT